MITRAKLMQLSPWLVFGALALIVLVGLNWTQGHHAKARSLALNTLAPVTDLPILNGSGSHFTTASWRGRPYVVHFFASWCPDCRAEHEELMTLAAGHIPLVGVLFKDRADKAAAYLQREGNPYVAVALDEDHRAAGAWGLNGVPETFIIDAYGSIRWHYVGVLTDDIAMDEFMPAWEAVVKESR